MLLLAAAAFPARSRRRPSITAARGMRRTRPRWSPNVRAHGVRTRSCSPAAPIAGASVQARRARRATRCSRVGRRRRGRDRHRASRRRSGGDVSDARGARRRGRGARRDAAPRPRRGRCCVVRPLLDWRRAELRASSAAAACRSSTIPASAMRATIARASAGCCARLARPRQLARPRAARRGGGRSRRDRRLAVDDARARPRRHVTRRRRSAARTGAPTARGAPSIDGARGRGIVAPGFARRGRRSNRSLDALGAARRATRRASSSPGATRNGTPSRPRRAAALIGGIRRRAGLFHCH